MVSQGTKAGLLGANYLKTIITKNQEADGACSRTNELIVLNAGVDAVSHHSNMAASDVVKTAPLVSMRRSET